MDMKPSALLLALALVAGPAAAQTAPAPALTPVDPENLVVFDTTKGRVIVELQPAIAPLHVERTRKLVRKHYYDDNVFYRVLAGDFAQTGEKQVGGDPTSGEGTIKSEAAFVPATPPAAVNPKSGFVGDMPVLIDPDGKAYVRYCPGMAATAQYEAPDSGDAQIFLTMAPAARLERVFTAWGKVVVGQEALKAMAPGEPPAQPDRILKARIAADIPTAERPKVFTAAQGTPAFDAAMAKAREDWGPALQVCMVKLPVEVR